MADLVPPQGGHAARSEVDGEPVPVTMGNQLDSGGHVKGPSLAKQRPKQRSVGSSWMPPLLRQKVKWAFTTSASTLLISLWCLRPSTRGLLPVPAFGAFVTVFLTSSTVGRTLRSSADCIFGASLATLLAWLLAFLHGHDEILTGLALLLQSFFWAYVELPMPGRRLALSTMVIVCLTARARPAGMPLAEVVGLVLLVVLSACLALLAVLIPLGPQCATSGAVASTRTAGRAVQLLVEKTVAAFLETDDRRQHIAAVQLGELVRAAKNSVSKLAESLDDAQWEPWFCGFGATDPLVAVRLDRRTLEEQLELLAGAQQALTGLPFNECHRAFASDLKEPLEAVTTALSALVPGGLTAREVPCDLVKRVQETLKVLDAAYGTARRELLYPPHGSPLEATSFKGRQVISWMMDDLLHMNTFLFTIMHLAALTASRCRLRHTTQPQGCVRCRVWISYARGLLNAFWPQWPWRLDSGRARSAVRFAVAIGLAASVDLVPSLRGKFELEIWAPVEVTFLMFKHAGGSLRQSVLRLQGALLGSVVGYLIALFLGGAPNEVLAMCLAFWSFCACVFRGSPTHGYAAIVAAWTAVIVVDAGVVLGQDPEVADAPESGVARAALERMTHTVVGVACLVLALNCVFPIWARDAARADMASALERFEGLYEQLQRTWLRRSKQMQWRDLESDRHSDSEQETAKLTSGEAATISPDKGADRDKLKKSADDIARRLTNLKLLVAEASVEPSLWRPPYQASASQEVTRLLEQMLASLQVFSTYILDMSAELKSVFGAQEPKRWLSQQWLSSLKSTGTNIASVLSGLHSALQQGGPGHWSGNASARDRPYLNAIEVEGLEGVLRRELRRFLKQYDWILTGTISDSQLKILAGVQTEQYLTNLDMLFYNSLVFAMRSFVQQLLRCSQAVRTFTVLEVGIVEAADVVEIGAISAPLLELEEELVLLNGPASPASRAAAARQREKRLASPMLSEGSAAAMSHLVLTVVGPDRLGIVHDISCTVFEYEGTIAASRMAKLGGDFAVVMKLLVPSAAVEKLNDRLCNKLRGLQVWMKEAKEEVEQEGLQKAEVTCVCPSDAPGLLMRFTSVLTESELNIVALDTEVVPTATGSGFTMRAQVTSAADAPLDEAALNDRLIMIRDVDGGVGPEAFVSARLATSLV